MTTLIFLGHMGPTKGFSIISRALEHLPRGLTLQIRLYGDQTHAYVSKCSPHLRAYLYPYPTLVGRQNEEAISDSDGVIVSSQWHENSPYVVLRALASGRPVLASRHAGIAHLIEEGRNGFLVEPSDVNAWADLLRRVAENPALLRGMRPHCSYTTTAESYCQELESVLSA